MNNVNQYYQKYVAKSKVFEEKCLNFQKDYELAI